MWYADLKVFFETYTGLERDALHVHAAILLYIIGMGLFRQSRRSRLPWLFVLVIELANEAFDLSRGYAENPQLAVSESVKDLWNTMLWPTVLLFVGRYTTWFRPKDRGRATGAEDETPAPAQA